MPEPSVLILGGTGEARELARLLDESGVPVVTSLAGRVADPRLPVGRVRVGGFGGVDGLAAWIGEAEITAIVDATHPFAARITPNAVAAAELTGVGYLRLARPPWSPGAGERWTRVPDIAAAATAVAERGGSRVFLTTGRQDVSEFAEIDDAWFLIRVVDPPEGPLPPHHRVLRSRGPYRLADETALLREHRIDVLVTKNSGGEMTVAKLRAAARLGVEVIVVDRPAEPGGIARVNTPSEALDWLSGPAGRGEIR
ncbi:MULTISPECIES: cobalt-precorrin-6A reductase [Gordonia]|uniref:Precorrin-6X reductase n=2 Tax=Gordonia TaxID=2053 RepID=L7LHX0_9ACTN|nr:cobalt-precorrin-6A reductase [Gordonia sihwensis]MBY4570671.1 precorrin-6A reductase [Gordonia sihwensis]GAC59692.1 precorrin-6X reductase [Gordonia sihwensis NBRC 108236]